MRITTMFGKKGEQRRMIGRKIKEQERNADNKKSEKYKSAASLKIFIRIMSTNARGICRSGHRRTCISSPSDQMKSNITSKYKRFFRVCSVMTRSVPRVRAKLPRDLNSKWAKWGEQTHLVESAKSVPCLAGNSTRVVGQASGTRLWQRRCVRPTSTAVGATQQVIIQTRQPQVEERGRRTIFLLLQIIL